MGLLVAGTAKENHPDLVDYYRKVRVWIAELERDGVIINGTTYKVSFELLPVDQKFLTILAGELSNSSTYPTTFGDIHKDKLGTLSPVSQPWLYGKRITDAVSLVSFVSFVLIRLFRSFCVCVCVQCSSLCI